MLVVKKLAHLVPFVPKLGSTLELLMAKENSTDTANALEALRALIKEGDNALARGEYVEVADAELERYLEGLTLRAQHTC